MSTVAVDRYVTSRQQRSGFKSLRLHSCFLQTHSFLILKSHRIHVRQRDTLILIHWSIKRFERSDHSYTHFHSRNRVKMYVSGAHWKHAHTHTGDILDKPDVLSQYVCVRTLCSLRRRSVKSLELGARHAATAAVTGTALTNYTALTAEGFTCIWFSCESHKRPLIS